MSGTTSHSAYNNTSKTISGLTNGQYYCIVAYYPVTNSPSENGGQSDTYNSKISSGATLITSIAVQDCTYKTSSKGLGIKLYLVKTTSTSITFTVNNKYSDWFNWGLIKITRS